MSELNIQQQQQLSQYLNSNPEVPKEQALVLLFGNPKASQSESLKGVTVEKTSDTANGNTKEPEISYVTYKATDGKTYNINKTFENRINNVTTNLKKSENENGFIGSAWSGFKNLTGIGDSSDKVREFQANEQKLLAQFNTEASDKPKIFEQLTGQKYTPENLEKFIKGEIALKSEQALNGYNEGQSMAVDVGADIVSGVAAVGIYTAAVAAAPFTGGTSIAVGVVAATASGAAIKSGMKFADAKTGGREYDSLGKDMATGAFSGALAPVTAGFGGAVGKTVAAKLGVQTVKTIGKETAEEVVETGVKQTIKTALTNPAGYEYLGGNAFKRGAAYAAEMASDGAVGGAIDNSFRAAVDGGSLSDVAEAAEEGFIGGAFLSPVIGGGFKAASKTGSKIGEKVKSVLKNADEPVPVIKPNINAEEMKAFQSKLDNVIKEQGRKGSGDYRASMVEIANIDKDLADKVLERFNDFNGEHVNEILKAAKQDNELTLNLLNKKTKNGMYVFYLASNVRDAVKAAQENKELALEVLSKINRANSNCVYGMVQLAKIDKSEAFKQIKKGHFNSSDEYMQVANAMEANKSLTSELLKNDVHGVLRGNDIAHIIKAAKNAPELMENLKNELLVQERQYETFYTLTKNYPLSVVDNAKQNLLQKGWAYQSLSDYAKVAQYVNLYGADLAYKSLDDLNISQKRNLLNQLSSNKFNHGTPDLVKKIFPCVPETSNPEEFNGTLKKLLKDINSTPAKMSEVKIQKFNDELDGLMKKSTAGNSAEFQELRMLLDNYIPDVSKNIDGKLLKETGELLSKIGKNKQFKTLNNSEQRKLILSTILSNNKSANMSVEDIAFDAYKTVQSLGLSEFEAADVYKIVQSADLAERFMKTDKRLAPHSYDNEFDITNRRFIFDNLAFNLKERDNFKLAQMLYSAKEVEGLTRNLDKLLVKRIKQMKSADFALPQTSAENYQKLAKNTFISRNGINYNVKVVNASEIQDFYAFIHNADGISGLKGDLDSRIRYTKVSAWGNIDNDRAICMSYISKDNNCSIGTGFIFEVPTSNQYAAAGHDIGSRSKDIKRLIAEYFSDNNIAADTHNFSGIKEYKSDERKMVSDNIKKILNISDDEYIKRMDNLKAELQGRTLTVKEIENIDTELASAYKEFLSRTNADSRHGREAILSNGEWNEVIVSNPKVCAIYANNINDVTGELLKKAQEENLPIVLLRQ